MPEDSTEGSDEEVCQAPTYKVTVQIDYEEGEPVSVL